MGTSLEDNRGAGGHDAVVEEGVVDRDKLVGDELDHLLGSHTTHERCDIVQLSSAITAPAIKEDEGARKKKKVADYRGSVHFVDDLVLDGVVVDSKGAQDGENRLLEQGDITLDFGIVLARDPLELFLKVRNGAKEDVDLEVVLLILQRGSCKVKRRENDHQGNEKRGRRRGVTKEAALGGLVLLLERAEPKKEQGGRVLAEPLDLLALDGFGGYERYEETKKLRALRAITPKRKKNPFLTPVGAKKEVVNASCHSGNVVSGLDLIPAPIKKKRKIESITRKKKKKDGDEIK